MTSRRPRLTPAIADVRRAVRESLTAVLPLMRPSLPGPTPLPELVEGRTLILVGLSGGADSLALAAATAFEAPRAKLRAGAIIVDHGLQEGSADVAAQAAEKATKLGLEPVIVTRVQVGTEGGPEAAAREARYHAYAAAIESTGASAVLLGHTLDDQAETVLLGLARGSGAGSLQGMSPVVRAEIRAEIRKVAVPDASEAPESGSHGPHLLLRPLLGIRRSITEAFCADSGLEPWTDPHNSDPTYTRVRVRNTVLPVLERELGPGIAVALARTAEQMREDESALDQFAEELIEDLAEHAEAGLALSAAGLLANPSAVRQRLIRLAVSAEFGLAISRTQTLEVARLVTDWHGQGAVHLPGVRVERRGHLLVFSAAT